MIRAVLKKLITVNVGLYMGVVVLFVMGGFLSPGFLRWSHVATIMRLAAFLGFASMGQTLAVLTGGIDLSIGPVITAGNVFSAMLIAGQQENTLLAFLFAIAFGSVVGLLTGAGVAFLEISPLVMSLAVGVVVEGVTLIFSKGAPKGNASPALYAVATGKFLGIPGVVWIWLFAAAIFIFILRKTTFGQKVYAVGANEVTAHFSGINTKKVKVLVYIISASLAALTGFLMTGYTQTAYLGIGAPYTLASIAAVVIGGNDLLGGVGGYVGTIAGVIILKVIESLLTTLSVPEAGRRIVSGAILLTLLFVHVKRGKRIYKEV